jgi:hypothetical protein
LTSPSYPSWSTIFGQNGWNADKCQYDAALGTQGTFIGGGVVRAALATRRAMG